MFVTDNANDFSASARVMSNLDIIVAWSLAATILVIATSLA